MANEKQYEQIERFLDQEMSPEERQAFQGRMEKEPDLYKEVQLHQELRSGLAGERMHQLRAVMGQVDKEWQATPTNQPAKVRVLNWRAALGIAAALAIAIIGYTLWEQNNVEAPETLFAQHFEPYDINFALNDRSDSDNRRAQKLRTALDNYKKEDYALANQEFADLLAGDPENVIFLFYTALTHLSLNQTSEAIPHLQQLVNMPPNLFSQQSQWYLALAYLQQGDTAAAGAQLEKINSGDYKYEEARSILNRL